MHPMAKYSLDVDGKSHAIDADPDMPLLYALRNDVGLNNPHFGCGVAQCGACTVHLNGQPIRSCVTPVSAVGNGKIVTLAGLGTPEKPHPLQTAYVAGAGHPVRLLRERLDHDGGRASCATPRSRPTTRSSRRWRASSAAAAPTWASCAPSSAPPR